MGRALVILAAIVLLLSVVGWISFQDTATDATIKIEKEKIEQDTKALVDTARGALDGGATEEDSSDGLVNEPGALSPAPSPEPVSPPQAPTTPVEPIPAGEETPQGPTLGGAG